MDYIFYRTFTHQADSVRLSCCRAISRLRWVPGNDRTFLLRPRCADFFLNAPNIYLLFVLDTLPLFIAISTYVVFWPGKFIGDGTPPTPGNSAKESSIDSVPVEPKEG